MTRDELLAHAARLGRNYRLGSPTRMSRGPAGVYQGGAGGQSIDFHDYREYQPGDDLRRVDWRAYARSGALHLKLFREEISPVVEIILDTSASMAVYPGKEQAAFFVAALLGGVARAAGGRPVLCRNGARFAGGEFEGGLRRAAFGGAGLGTGTVEAGGPATERPWRFLLSDFLFPEGGAALFARRATGALAFSPLMFLAREEREPAWSGGLRLVDAEEPARVLDQAASAAAFARYRERLRRHEDGLGSDAARHGGRLLPLTVPDGGLAEEELDALARSLMDAGIIVPAGGGR